jgi:hypothetical protein
MGSIYDRGLYHQGPYVKMTITDHLFLSLSLNTMMIMCKLIWWTRMGQLMDYISWDKWIQVEWIQNHCFVTRFYTQQSWGTMASN